MEVLNNVCFDWTEWQKLILGLTLCWKYLLKLILKSGDTGTLSSFLFDHAGFALLLKQLAMRPFVRRASSHASGRFESKSQFSYGHVHWGLVSAGVHTRIIKYRHDATESECAERCWHQQGDHQFGNTGSTECTLNWSHSLDRVQGLSAYLVQHSLLFPSWRPSRAACCMVCP